MSANFTKETYSFIQTPITFLNTKEEPVSKKSKKNRLIKIIILIILILLIFILGIGIFKARKVQNTAYLNTATVKTGTIEVVKEGSGTVSAKASKSITVPYDSKVVSVKVENGDRVEKGDIIAIMESDNIQNYISQVETELSDLDIQIKNTAASGDKYITSSVNGRIKAIYAEEGTAVRNTMEKQGALMEIAADGKLKVEIINDDDYKIGYKLTVNIADNEESGTVSAYKTGKIIVTIPDSNNYNLGDKAVVEDKDGETVGEGKLASNQPYYVTGSYGTVNNIRYNLNDKVYEGNTLITLRDVDYSEDYIRLLEERNEKAFDLQKLNAYMDNLVITAPIDGVISGLSSAAGSEVTASTAYTAESEICKILNTEVYELKADVDELDIDGIQVGQTAEITFDAFEDETINGKVTKISNLGSNTNGVTTYTVTLEMDGSDRIKSNMSATAKIVTQRSENALIIPVDAIQTIGDKKYVTVVTTENNMQSTSQREVTLGVVNSANAEITSGLNEGEEVEVISDSDTETKTSPFGGRNGNVNTGDSNTGND